ncbi:MAG TPA: pyridoxamine 5'-phosphate oxidase [Phaeodactylibacter sp.]|nr:pyridoxamine 5'-phosphate oxidase [Phaeodactylibacter sp.]
MNRDLDKIAHLRQDYRLLSLKKEDLDADPIRQFSQWFKDAMDANIQEPNVMCLATATKEGKPSARILLLKGFDEKGFVFYTNYHSRKGKELLENPHAAMVFHWAALERQVRIEGKISLLPDEESDRYYQSRPRDSRIGAWASPQSEVIKNRSVLEEKVKDLQKKYTEENPIPRPAHWGGYRLCPTMIEFWQGRASRLHDRFRYTRDENGTWKIERLAP